MIRILYLMLVFFGGSLFAQPPLIPIEKIGGVYQIKVMEPLKEGGFRVVFESEVKTGKGDIIILDSDHLHLGLKEGQSLRLSAEVLQEPIPDYPVSMKAMQILVFLPQIEGPAPVWLLSKQSNRRRSIDGEAESLLKMHAPQSDYRIL